MKVRDACRKLQQMGWQQVRQRGGHRQFKHPQHPRLVTVAGAHGGKEAKKDVVKLIEKLEGT